MSFSFAESEYSAEAEAAYAEFASADEEHRSEEAFEALCDAHPELADELEGLHADFASVQGVLRRMDRSAAEDPEAELPATGYNLVAVRPEHADDLVETLRSAGWVPS